MQIRKYTLRFSLVFLLFIICLIVFAVKLTLIQVFRSSHLASLAEKQHNHFIELESIRGTIFDRKLKPLALNVSAYSLYANPRMMTDEDKLAAVDQLSSLLNIDETYLQKRLAKKKYFVWLKRKLSAESAESVKALKIKSLNFINESKRYYPNKSLAAHIIGFAGLDNNGLEGVELKYEKYLKGKSGWTKILRDARQKELMIEKNFIAPIDGFHIILTIDETVQYIAERALDAAYKEHKAKAATIIVMDVRTGEILALANRPTYNLENAGQSSIRSRTNRAVSFVYEPGSVFKIVTAAAALEEEVYMREDEVFCEEGEYRVGNHILQDHHPYGLLSFNEVFAYSSNIGVTKIAQELGASTIYQYAQRFRFGMKTGVDMKGEVAGLLKPPSVWSKTTIGAIPIGHEVTVTPLQMLCALSAIANDGVYMKPFLVKYIKDSRDEIIKSFGPQVLDRVISIDTARQVTGVLMQVVEKGTGKRARIKGLKVAGKTGTAQKVIDGQYSHSQYDATFMGFAPADNPRLAVIVILDEPGLRYFGGTVAAPVFKEVIENSLRYLESME